MKILLYMNCEAYAQKRSWVFAEYFPLFWINTFAGRHRFLVVVPVLRRDDNPPGFAVDRLNGEVMGFDTFWAHRQRIMDSIDFTVAVVPSRCGRRLSAFVRSVGGALFHYIRGDHFKSVYYRYRRSPLVPLYAVAALKNEHWLRRASPSVPTFFVGRKLEQRYRGERSSVIYENNISLQDIRASQTAPVSEGLHFIYVGRFTGEKGVHRLAPYFRWLSAQSPEAKKITFTLVGDGPERARCVTALRAIPALAVRDLGEITDSGRVLDLLNRSHFLVSLSYTEGLPKTLIEAQSQGCVPIMTDVGSIGTVLTDGENGLVAPAEFTERESPPLSYGGLCNAFVRLSENANQTARQFCFERQKQRVLSFIAGQLPSFQRETESEREA